MSYETRALAAWACVLKAIKTIGHRRSFEFDDPIVNAAVREVGNDWITFCGMMHQDSEPFVAKKFQEAYVSLCKCGTHADRTTRFIGPDERNAPELWASMNKSQVVKVGLPPHLPGTIKGELTEGDQPLLDC